MKLCRVMNYIHTPVQTGFGLPTVHWNHVWCNPDVEVYTRKQSIEVTVAGYWEGGRDNGSRAAARELSVDLRHHLPCG